MRNCRMERMNKPRLAPSGKSTPREISSALQLQFVGFSAQELSCVCATVIGEVYVIGKLLHPS
ncbi:hypothetical protein OP10G_0511 [Fimbriimonas ginsengisoli Gsoil 348]|uniref:Uncharacterized protein n=1 Tax=Fimbriimonas ginsengisoli Gsoil 348 TaxID=661478 RepID=A0A068NQJ7_FIMGI|nr:hypothetical protein OP10G_0511 [Fimbriimonas ginsengisoli Gsoil 348]